MLKQASSRNQRTKGFRVKQALQIFILVAVCFWLLYQVKHSHDKKRAFEERNSRVSNEIVESQPDFFKFGRKDLPHSEEADSVNETRNKEEENEEAQGEEQETKQEETMEEDGRGAGDDEIDEQDQEKADEEAEHGEESTEEEDKDGQVDEIDLFDSQDHEAGSQEAREENYKRDDASSAVVHDTHATESETGSGDARNTDEEKIVDGSHGDNDSSVDGSKGDLAAENVEKKGDVAVENVEKRDVEAENVANGTVDGSNGDNDLSVGAVDGSMGNVSGIVLKDNEAMPNDNLSTNGTAAENKKLETEFSKPDKSVSNSTTVEYNYQTELQTNSTTAAESNSQMELPTNSTASVDNQTEMQNNSTVVDAVTTGVAMSNDTVILDSAQDQNTTVYKGILGEDEPNSEKVVEEATEKSNRTVGVESEVQSSTSSATNENEDSGRGESDDTSHDVLIEEERDARMDLSTLPDIQNEAKPIDDEMLRSVGQFSD